MIGSIIFLLCFAFDLIIHDLVLRFQYIFSRGDVHELFQKFQKKRVKALYSYARVYTGFKIEVESELKEPLPKTFIVIANHISLVDIVAMFYIFSNHRIRFVAKKQLKKWIPTISFGARISKNAFIDRKGDFANTYKELIRLGKSTKEDLCPVIFPEGTRSKTGEVGKFFTAAVRLIVENSEVPILSVALGTSKPLTTLKELIRNIKGTIYKVKILNIHEHPKTRKETKILLDRIYNELSGQVKKWHTTGIK